MPGQGILDLNQPPRLASESMPGKGVLDQGQPPRLAFEPMTFELMPGWEFLDLNQLPRSSNNDPASIVVSLACLVCLALLVLPGLLALMPSQGILDLNQHPRSSNDHPASIVVSLACLACLAFFVLPGLPALPALLASPCHATKHACHLFQLFELMFFAPSPPFPRLVFFVLCPG